MCIWSRHEVLLIRSLGNTCSVDSVEVKRVIPQRSGFIGLKTKSTIMSSGGVMHDNNV